mmetsp:Transcript_31230/g.28403  ORF Transcript_31230/g.28403 Transcript_31230/m.28403 type:complete len:160 (+) Transcript_31230:28-507(+)
MGSYQKFLTFALLIICAYSYQRVTSMPEWPDFTGKFEMYSGYIPVGTNGEELFFILTTSMAQPAQDPIVLWLNGGPGCSSLNGFLWENGPWVFDGFDTTPPRAFNPYAWNTHANVLYLDGPSGVGYSKGNIEQTEYSDTMAMLQQYTAIVEFLKNQPQY